MTSTFQTAASKLKGIRICHLSSVQNRLDPRAFNRQALPVTEHGLLTSIIGPHAQTGRVLQVEFISVPIRRSRIFRILLATGGIFPALQQHADVYHVHDLELVPAGLLLKLVFRERVVYDARECFPAMMLNKTYLYRPLRKLIGKAVMEIERLAAYYLDGLVTADAGTLLPLARTGKSKKLVFYNLPNLRFFPEPANGPKPFDLVYRGGLSERAGTLILLEALRILVVQGRPARLLMFGYADDERARCVIKERIRTLQLESLVEIRGMIKHSEMAATLGQARIAVSPLQAIPKFLINIPVKIFEYWACGLPVVASDLPPIRPFFGKNEYGLLVKPGDPRDLARAVRELLDHPEDVARMGQNARLAVVERYNNRSEVRKLLSLYLKVLNK